MANGVKKVQCEFCSNKVEKHLSVLSRSKKNHGSRITCGCEKTNPLVKEYLKLLRNSNSEFYLSYRQFVSLKNSPCYYCSDLLSGNLDVLSNKRGYFVENTVSLCESCRLAKGDKTHEEFIEYMKRITLNINKMKFGLLSAIRSE